MSRGFVVLRPASTLRSRSCKASAAVRDQIGAVTAFRDVRVVDALPNTRSGEILRRTMRNIVDGVDERAPSTIEDAAVLDRLRDVLRQPPG